MNDPTTHRIFSEYFSVRLLDERIRERLRLFTNSYVRMLTAGADNFAQGAKVMAKTCIVYSMSYPGTI